MIIKKSKKKQIDNLCSELKKDCKYITKIVIDTRCLPDSLFKFEEPFFIEKTITITIVSPIKK